MIDDLTDNPFRHAIAAGDKLFVFNDSLINGTGQDSTFRVYDNAGNLLLAEQRLTDATDDELAGWSFMGITLPYTTTVRHVQVHADGGFTLHYEGHSPIVQRDTPSADPKFVAQRSFAADGTPQPSEPGKIYLDPDGPNTNSIVDLPNGQIAEVWFGTEGTDPEALHLTLNSGTAEAIAIDITPTGEPYLGFLGVKASSAKLVVSGNTLHLIYQDVQSGDVYSRVYGMDGTELRPQINLGGTDNATLTRPAADTVNAAVLNDGRVVVTWSNQRDGVDTDPELFQAILSATGTVVRAPELVNTDLHDGSQYDGLVFPLSDGGYAIVYHTIGGTPYRQEALLRQFDASGNPVTASVAFEGDTPNQSLNAHFAAIFPNGFGYMLDGFGDEFTIRIEGLGEPSDSGLVLTGTPEADILTGAAGDDTITGLDGNDRLLGNAGNDSMDGGLGADTLNGGDGDDIIIGGPGEGDLRDVIFAGEGNDSVDAGAGNDQIFGQGGNDTIAGGAGVDEIQGQDGDDVITGSSFSDLVFGGAGDDFVNGGFGHDRINGGTGADKFFHVGASGHGSDWVQDYNAAEGDVLLFGIGSATRDQFQVNFNHTQNAEGERAGDDAVQEAFVIYRPTGQIMWALVDGEGQSSINLQIGSDVFDLLG
nr:calcium-binding protein [Ruegeria sp. PrR005]